MTDVAEKENIFLFIPNLIGRWIKLILFQCIIFCNCVITPGPLIPFDFIWFCMPCVMSSNDISFTGYARIILAIISFYFMQTNYIIAGWCYIISALLDAIDGHAARAFNQSEWICHYTIDLKFALNQINSHWFFFFLTKKM